MKIESKSDDSISDINLDEIKLPIKTYKVGREINNQKGLEIEKAKFN